MTLETHTDIRRIAIIGAGPTGIACAKFFVAEQAFSKIDVYEQRSNVGGIWNLSGNRRSQRVDVPQTNPRYGMADPLDQSLEFESPLYDYLETNIPKTLMAYSDLPFADDLPLYPKHEDVLRYLEEYAEPVKHLVRFQTQVIDLHPLKRRQEQTSPLKQIWTLTARDLESGTFAAREYDAVVVANGHYTVPHIPAIHGIADWNKQYPGVIIHSKAYRRPEDFNGKNVLVIGNSASGIDIASQVSSCAHQPVYLASRSASQFATAGKGPSWRHDIAEIEAFLVDDHNRAVRTKTGEVIENLDVVIFATGYYYSYPFLKLPIFEPPTDSSSESTPSLSSSVSTTDISESAQLNGKGSQTMSQVHHQQNIDGVTITGLRTHHTYKHFLHSDHPTLAMPVLNLKIIPFPLAENQAAVLARLWSGRLELPSKKEMQGWEVAEEQRLAAAHRLRPAPRVDVEDSVGALQGPQKYEGGFHTLAYPEDVNQINTLYSWAASAPPRDGLEHDGVGKLGTRRNEQQVWLRGQFADIKAAYVAHGERRTAIKTLEMLGDDWKNVFEHWSNTTSEDEKWKLFTQAGVDGW